MQSSYWGYWLVLMGVAIVGLMISVNGLTTTSTQDHYAVREILEASMLESVDYGYYRDYNEVKMNKEKFMEVFTRMMAESMNSTDTYEINFYEIFEAPPKVSVEVKSHSGANFISTSDYDVTTRESAIIQIHAEEVRTGSISNNTSSGSNTQLGTDINNGGNTGNNGGSSNNQGTSNGNNNGNQVGEIADTCKTGITTPWNNNIEGVSLTKSLGGTRGKIYETLNDIQNGNTANTRDAVPGVKFKILGETGNYWAIEYEGKCGWVDNRYMGISLTKFLPSNSYPIDYNITNASSSIFKVNGGSIGVTGKKLYSSEYNGFVPLAYTYAKTLKDSILPKAKSMGYRLVVIDAYRPDSVSRAVYSAAKPYANTNKAGTKCSSGLNCYNGKVMSLNWFIAETGSTHGIGCALDVTLKNGNNTIYDAYGDNSAYIHELSTRVLKYSNTGCYRKYSCNRNYVDKYNNSKITHDLDAIMMGTSVITDLPSEWWHFNHETCISNFGLSNTVDFWYNV